MTVENSQISRMLRNQAWERAKGELQSMLWTFQPPANANPGQFEAFNDKLQAFISAVENDGLNE